MGIAIAAPASGTGKTTLTLALLAALRQRGISVQSFKVGPDYIDPMFHQAATGSPCYTLDPFLTSEDYVRRCFQVRSQGSEAAVVEGVMGLFDGKVDEGDFASTAHIARLLDIPVVLAIDAEKVGRTVAAIAYGLIQYDPRLKIAGVIFNRVGSDRHAQLLRDAISPLNIPVLGMFRTTPDIHMPSRHLGLVPVEEQRNFERLLEQLAHLAEESFEWEKLLPLLRSPVATGESLWPDVDPVKPRVRMAIARDAAFNFYYADNLDLLKQLGAELIEFSPLRDGFNVVQDCDALYLGGGFPELFAHQLSERIRQWKPQQQAQLPSIYAECGGLMVLGHQLQDKEHNCYPMAGLLPYNTQMTKKLTLGYRTAQVINTSPLVWQSADVKGHEFHHSTCQGISGENIPIPSRIYQWQNLQEGWMTDSVHASYLHLHWGDMPGLPLHWLNQSQSLSIKSYRS